MSKQFEVHRGITLFLARMNFVVAYRHSEVLVSCFSDVGSHV